MWRSNAHLHMHPPPQQYQQLLHTTHRGWSPSQTPQRSLLPQSTTHAHYYCAHYSPSCLLPASRWLSSSAPETPRAARGLGITERRSVRTYACVRMCVCVCVSSWRCMREGRCGVVRVRVRMRLRALQSAPERKREIKVDWERREVDACRPDEHVGPSPKPTDARPPRQNQQSDV